MSSRGPYAASLGLIIAAASRPSTLNDLLPILPANANSYLLLRPFNKRSLFGRGWLALDGDDEALRLMKPLELNQVEVLVTPEAWDFLRRQGEAVTGECGEPINPSLLVDLPQLLDLTQVQSVTRILRVSDVLATLQLHHPDFNNSFRPLFRNRVTRLLEKDGGMRRLRGGRPGWPGSQTQVLWTSLPEGQEPEDWEMQLVVSKEHQEYQGRFQSRVQAGQWGWHRSPASRVLPGMGLAARAAGVAGEEAMAAGGEEVPVAAGGPGGAGMSLGGGAGVEAIPVGDEAGGEGMFWSLGDDFD